MAATGQVIKTTGGAANVTAQQVGQLAEAISRKTGVDDEAIQTGQNVLLSMTNVRNEAGRGRDIFNQATQAMADLAATGRTDLTGAATMIGKALNDPIKGLTSLTRVGVTFNAQQREQIKTMVEAGNVVGAQQVILGGLQQRFGGLAAATGTASDRMRVTLGNLQERIGAALVPVVDKLAGAVTRVVDIFNRTPGPIQAVAAGGAALAVVAGGLIAAFEALRLKTVALTAAKVAYRAVTLAVSAATKAWTGIQWALNAALTANPIGIAVAAVAALAAGVYIAYQRSEAFRNAVAALGRVIGDVAGAVGRFVSGALAKAASFIGEMQSLPARAVLALASLPDKLYELGRDAMESLGRGLRSIIGRIAAIASDIANEIRSRLNPANWFSTPEEHYRRLWGDAFAAIAEQARRHLPDISRAVRQLTAAGTAVPIAAAGAYMVGGRSLSASPQAAAPVSNNVTNYNLSIADLSLPNIRRGDQAADLLEGIRQAARQRYPGTRGR